MLWSEISAILALPLKFYLDKLYHIDRINVQKEQLSSVTLQCSVEKVFNHCGNKLSKATIKTSSLRADINHRLIR